MNKAVILLVVFVGVSLAHFIDSLNLHSTEKLNQRWEESRATSNKRDALATCTIMKCDIGANGDCNKGDGHLCSSGYYCNVTTQSSKCLAQLGEGQECKVDTLVTNPCDVSKYLSCVDVGSGVSKCQKAYYLMPGMSCSQNYECYPGLTCSGGKCSGKNKGDACSMTEQCNWGLWCNAQKCDDVKASGATCSLVNADECGYYGVCSAETSGSMEGKCTETYYSKGSDAVCFTTPECNVPGGLYCKRNSTTAITGTCAPRPTSSNDDCDDDPDCKNDNVCVCNYNTGKGKCEYPTSSDLVKRAQDVLNCGKNNKCYLLSTDTPGSCMTTKCKTELGCFNKAVSDFTASSRIPGCPTYYDTTCSAATALGAGMLLFIAAVIVALLF